MNTLINYINNQILRRAATIQYTIKDIAPSNARDLFSSTSLVIWSGASDNTIYQDEQVNWAFRALHDSLHLKTGLLFTIEHEIELGRIQAATWDSDVMRHLVYAEVSGQAAYYRDIGYFIDDQAEFTLQYLKQRGII